MRSAEQDLGARSGDTDCAEQCTFDECGPGAGDDARDLQLDAGIGGVQIQIALAARRCAAQSCAARAATLVVTVEKT